MILLFRGVDERANDEATEGGVWLWVGGWITFGFLAVLGEFLLPFGAEFGSVQNDRSQVDCVLESRDGALTFGSHRTFIRMFDYISVSATIASAHDNLIV